jgi:hypothetical protein
VLSCGALHVSNLACMELEGQQRLHCRAWHKRGVPGVFRSVYCPASRCCRRVYFRNVSRVFLDDRVVDHALCARQLEMEATPERSETNCRNWSQAKCQPCFHKFTSGPFFTSASLFFGNVIYVKRISRSRARSTAYARGRKRSYAGSKQAAGKTETRKLTIEACIQLLPHAQTNEGQPWS